ncbi:MAG TPA: hypothetical protein VJS69_12290 [Candidatus Krumholzibacteria bacterium]|nr:hypothetical protein [Candidatus Krumholzibacteria bacterium]
MKLPRFRSLVVAMAALAAVSVIACGGDGSTPVTPPPAGGDTSPPESVLDLTLAFDPQTSALVFAWTAPRDDARHARVDHYDVRYSEAFPFDWNRATSLADPPLPADPGVGQQMTLPSPPRRRDYYASVRAVDAAGNMAPVGAVAHARAPGYSLDLTCTDTYTGAPIAGMYAIITTESTRHFVTQNDGHITIADVGSNTASIALTTGTTATVYHSYNDAFPSTADVSQVIAMIPFQQPQTALFPTVLALLKTGNYSVGAVHTIKRWHSYPVLFYARDFVNANGLDYRALLQQAADRWNTRLGFQMFATTDADPATGILVEFLPRSAMGITNGITNYSNDADGYPAHDHISLVDDLADGQTLYTIFMHELGHTIPLGHLPPGFIMQSNAPLPNDITDDEVTMVKLLLALPNGTVLDHYDQTPLP